MKTMTIIFRNDPDVEIEYEDHGYDPETNDSGIEWSFTDPALQDVVITREEELRICTLIAECSMKESE